MTRNTLIRLLNEQRELDDGKSFIKINIHLALPGPMAKYCLDLNQEVQLITESQVDFRSGSFQIPHLTLQMGYLKSENEFKHLMDELPEFSNALSAFEVEPLRPYLVYPNRNYIFVDIASNKLVLDVKRKAKNKFKKWILPLGNDHPKEAAHITVGYITDRYSEVEEMISSYSIGPKWIANTIAISYAGSRGSCIGTIRSFEFSR